MDPLDLYIQSHEFGLKYTIFAQKNGLMFQSWIFLLLTSLQLLGYGGYTKRALLWPPTLNLKLLMKGNNSKIFSKDPEWIKNIIERNIVCRWLLKDCFIEHEELDWIFKTHEKLIKYLPAWQNNKVNCDIQKLSRRKRLSIEKITLVSHSLHTREQKRASSPCSKRKTARKIFGILLQLRLRRLGTVGSDVNWYLWGWKQRDN